MRRNPHQRRWLKTAEVADLLEVSPTRVHEILRRNRWIRRHRTRARYGSVRVCAVSISLFAAGRGPGRRAQQ